MNISKYTNIKTWVISFYPESLEVMHVTYALRSLRCKKHLKMRQRLIDDDIRSSHLFSKIPTNTRSRVNLQPLQIAQTETVGNLFAWRVYKQQTLN